MFDALQTIRSAFRHEERRYGDDVIVPGVCYGKANQSFVN
jgi:hypothetical protein